MNQDSRRPFRIATVLVALFLAASSCGSDGTSLSEPEVAVRAIDARDNQSESQTPGVGPTAVSETEPTPEPTPRATASPTPAPQNTPAPTATATAEPTAVPTPAPTAVPRQSPGTVCRAAGFDFEPWLSICSEAQTERTTGGSIADSSFVHTIPVAPTSRIADGQPQPGAGYISEANELIAYTIELSAGEAVYVTPDLGGWSQGCSLGSATKLVNYQAFAPDGTSLGRAVDNDNCPRGTVAIPAVEDGTYTLVVGAWGEYGDKRGDSTYAFNLNQIQIDRFSADRGATINGLIDTPGSADVYTIALEKGDLVDVSRQELNGDCGLGGAVGFEWTVTAPSGQILIDRDANLSNNCARDYDDFDIRAEADGDYTIAITGTYSLHNTRTGTYTIELGAG